MATPSLRKVETGGKIDQIRCCPFKRAFQFSLEQANMIGRGFDEVVELPIARRIDHAVEFSRHLSTAARASFAEGCAILRRGHKRARLSEGS